MGRDLEEFYNMPGPMSSLQISRSAAILDMNNCEYSVIGSDYMCDAPKLYISIRFPLSVGDVTLRLHCFSCSLGESKAFPTFLIWVGHKPEGSISVGSHRIFDVHSCCLEGRWSHVVSGSSSKITSLLMFV